MKRLAFLFFALFISASAQAYPIFYKCDARRHMTESLTGPELDQQLRKFVASSKNNPEQAITALCEGVQECEQQLKQILALAKIDQALASKLFEDELKRLYSQSPDQAVQKLDEASFETRKKLMAASLENAACRATIEKLPASSFLKNGKVLFYYPNQCEYTYVTGCRYYPRPPGPEDVPGWQCNPNDQWVLEQGIRRALLMGADPYAAVAIGLMEGGQNGIGQLYLDPIGKFKVMGCKGGKGKGKLHSYGNLHDILPGVIEDRALSSRLETALKSNSSNKPGNSYLCRRIDNSNPVISTKPDSNSCCLALGFTPADIPSLESALTFEHVRQVCNNPKPLKADPAYRLQRFNGFSHLMGGGESVSTFRMGADYFKNPAYGYQGMDYVLNSLMTNPAMREMVDRIAKETGADYQNLLCQDVAVPGTYQIDSRFYFERHRNTPRLLALKNKEWKNMTAREKKVMYQEMTDPRVLPKLKARFGDSVDLVPGERFQADTIVQHPNGVSYKVTQVMSVDPSGGKPVPPQTKVEPLGKTKKSLLPTEKEIQSGSFVLDKKKAKQGYTLETKGPGSSTKVKVTFFGDFLEKHGDQAVVLHGAMPNTPHTIHWDGGKIVVTPNEAAKASPALPGFGGFGGFQNMTLEYFDANGKPTGMTAIPEGKEITYEFPDGSGFRTFTVSSSNSEIQSDGLAMLTSSTTLTYPDQSMTKITAKIGAAPFTDSNAAKTASYVKYYFNKIYPERNTIGKASELPWAPMSDEVLHEISGRVRGEK